MNVSRRAALALLAGLTAGRPRHPPGRPATTPTSRFG